MSDVNLQAFYVVKAPGLFQIAASHEEAQAMCDQHADQLRAQFAAWEAGDVMFDGLVESRLESDCDGGCYQSFGVRSDLWASFETIERYSVSASNWQDEAGFEKIRWGNPAFERPTYA